MEQQQQKRRPSVTIIDPIIPQRSNPSSPSNRSIPLPLPLPLAPPSPLQRSRDGSIILPSPPTHEPEDILISSRRIKPSRERDDSQESLTRERERERDASIASATTSTSSLSLPPSPITFNDRPLENTNTNSLNLNSIGSEEEEELEELADEDEHPNPTAVSGASLSLPQFDPSTLQNRGVSKQNQAQADLSLTLLAVQLAALKALHSLLSNFLSSSLDHSSGSAPEISVNVESTSASTSTSTSTPAHLPPRELLSALLDSVEEFSKLLLPRRDQTSSPNAASITSTLQEPESFQTPIEKDEGSLGLETRQEASLSRMFALLENLPSLNVVSGSSNLLSQSVIASPSDIQLSSTLGALVKSLDRVRNEANKNRGSKTKLMGDGEESEGEESGSGGSFSAPGSATLSEGLLDPISPVSPSLESPPNQSSKQSQGPNDHCQEIRQASSSSSSLPLTATTSHEIHPHQRRGSFPTTTASPHINLIEEQLRDPFAETIDSQQHQEPDVFSTLHKLMANLSGRNLPVALGGGEKEKEHQDFETNSNTFGAITSIDSQLLPSSPASNSEPFGDHRISSNPTMVNNSDSLDPISQASHLLAITRELVAARRAIHSPTSRNSYGYGLSSSSLRSRSAGASSASFSSQNQSMSAREIGGGGIAVGSQNQNHEMENQAFKGDLSNGLGRLSRTSSGSARSEREENQIGSLSKNTNSPLIQSPNLSHPTRSSLPPRYEDDDGGMMESRSVDTHGSLRSSLIGSGTSTLPAYAGLGVTSSEKDGFTKEKEKDRGDGNSIHSGSRSQNGSSTAIQTTTPQSILRNPLHSQQVQMREKGNERERERARARSPSGRSEYAARTSADLSLVQSSIERLYTAVPQLADQRVAPPPRLTAATNNNNSNSIASTSQINSNSSLGNQTQIMDINIEELVMRMGRRGRMEDQRADLSLKSKSHHHPSLNLNTSSNKERLSEKEESATSSPSAHQSRFSVGSLSGLGGLRRIGTKGKSREESSNSSTPLNTSPNNSSNNHNQNNEIDEIFHIQSKKSNFNSPQISPNFDQSFEEKSKTKSSGGGNNKKSKLEKMGMSNTESEFDEPDLDDPLFDLLASSSSSRITNQEAVLRPGSRLLRANNNGNSGGD